MSFVLTFGKHKDKSLDSLLESDLEYVVWLAGYERARERPPRFFRRFDDFVTNEWEQREVPSHGCAICGPLPAVWCYGHAHLPECYFFILDKTLETTRTRAISVIASGEASFGGALLLKPWCWVAKEYPDAIAAAAALLRGRCFECGGRLQPIGSSRANGAAHDDWDGRNLHKQCFRLLGNE